MLDTISTVQEVKNPIYINIDWGAIENGVNFIVNKIKKSNWEYDYIYAIPRGGLVLGTLLSYKLNVPLLTTLEDFNKTSGSILVVDDILDSGKTMLNNISNINNKQIDVFSFVYKTLTSNIIPKYCFIIPDFEKPIEEYNRLWYKFPWE
jgi:hypoxanthine phosphoribosyltransferase